MAIIDSHNWAGNNDSGWVNRTETGAVFVFGGRKFFVPTADQAYKCGHYRQEPIIGQAGMVWRMPTLLSHSDTLTDCQVLLRDKTGDVGNDGPDGFGAYFTGGQILCKDGTSYAGTPVPYSPLVFIDIRVKMLPNGHLQLFKGTTLLAISQATYPFIDRPLHCNLWVSRVGGGTGFVAVDNYRVTD